MFEFRIPKLFSGDSLQEELFILSVPYIVSLYNKNKQEIVVKKLHCIWISSLFHKLLFDVWFEHLEQERTTAVKLANKEDADIVCAQFDFTKRAKVKGEFPSVILNFNNEEAHNLRPLPLGKFNLTPI